MKIIIGHGYFNPIHIGHINYLREAKMLGDFLIVVINNDEQVKIKGSVPFMPESERLEIVKAIKYVDEVFLSIDKDKSVCESLKEIVKRYPQAEFFFPNGGDRHQGNIPEVAVCQKYNIKMVDDVGGGKIQSSSWLISKASKTK